MQRSRLLDNIELLNGLSGDMLAKLAADCRWRDVEKGAEIVAAEAGATDVCFVSRGRVRVTFYSPGGREVAFRDLSEGSSFGELSAIDGEARSASVVTLDDSVIVSITRDRFWRLLHESPEVSANVLRSLAALVRDLSARVVDTTVLTVPQRVRAEIVRLARATGHKAKSALIPKSPTHAELASQIGATREAVSRELSRLASQGFVERRGRDLLVHEVALLAATIETLNDS